MRITLFVVACLFATSAPLRAETATRSELDIRAMRASVVQVFTTSQAEDYVRPWQRPRASMSGGSAFFIGGDRLVTNAHVVSDARNLLVKRADSPKRYEARVLFAGDDCDLAMLTTDDKSFFEGMKPLEIGDRPAMRSTVATVGYPTGGSKLSMTEGVVSRIEVQTYVHSDADQHLAIQIDAAINPGNSGGPVIQGDKVVGVAFQGQFFSQSIGYMIPPSVVRHFLRDVEDDVYHGYPELGLYTEKLENDTLRKYLGVPDGESGVLILKAMPYASAVGHAQRNDVLQAIDGHKIQNDGTIEIEGDFFEYTHVVEDKQVGETVELSIRRKGEPMKLTVTLKAWGARMIPATRYAKKPEFMVWGGYMFCPVTTNYLSQSGASNELRYYFNQYYRLEAEEGKTREQLVVISRVFPHRTTRYQSYRNDIVATVNAKEPKDFDEFVRFVDAGGDIVSIEFEGVNTPPLFINRKTASGAHGEICKKFGITAHRHVEGLADGDAPKEGASDGTKDDSTKDDGANR